MEHKTRIKEYLNDKLIECEQYIITYKKQTKVIKTSYYILLVSSIAGQTAVSVLAPLLIPTVILSIISGVTALATAISSQLQLRDKTIKLQKKLMELRKIKDRIEYIDACNGDITGNDVKQIMLEFREL